MEKRTFIKGFDKDLQCRGYQFEVGKEYKIDLPEGYKLTENDLCSDKVFHFCDSLEKVHKYYSCEREGHRYCIIEVLGQFCEDEDKCGSDYIRVVREITGDELRIAKGLTNGNAGLFNSGYCNSGNFNSGYCNSGNFNSGNRNSGWRNSGSYNNGDYNSGNCNSGDYNSGDWNSGNYNSGDYNSGNFNSGDYNSGNWNSGDYNSGSYNSGDYNSGNWNSGNCNSGDYNSGDWNSGNYNSGDYNSGIFNKANLSNGVFCTVEPKICIFNIPTNMTLQEFCDSEYYDAINSSKFPLTEWDEKTQELKENIYEEACQKWWENMTEENREIIKSMPNFNVDIFCEITGIDKSEV